MLYQFLFFIFPNFISCQNHQIIDGRRVRDITEVLWFNKDHNETIEVSTELYDLYSNTYILMCQDV